LSDILGEKVRLYGYDLKIESNSDGKTTLLVALYWQCLQPMQHSYTVFVHLLDVDERIVAQADALPLGGRFGTLFWQPGDQLRGEYRLDLPDSKTQGPLSLRVGMYIPASNERLALTDSGSTADSVAIGPFWLQAEHVVFEEQVH